MQNFDDSIVHKIGYGHGFSGHGTAKMLFAAVFVAMVVLIGVASADSSLYSGGDGTSGDPYQIHNSSDIRYLSTHSGDWDKSFIVMNDIDLALGGSPTATIGNVDSYPNNVFSGTFDGQGYTIRNFNLSIAGDFVGLFGVVGSGGNIRNLNVETDANGVHGNNYVGVIVGSNSGSLTNCSATGNVTVTGDYAGGLVGDNGNGGSITDCYATGSATAVNNAGGLAGDNWGSLENCYATGDVTAASDSAGGLVGFNGNGYYTCTITNCYATGDVTAASDSAGGLAGSNTGGSITDCYATGSATATGNSAGGLVGWNSFGFLTNCYATGSASAAGFAGGLVGYNMAGSITNCYATGSASVAVNDAGGLVGFDDSGTITNCYRYTSDGNSEGIWITDITQFKNIRFLTGTDFDNGLSWDTGDISTGAESSKIWRVSEYNVQYPIFQWQSFENATLLVDSSPVGATIYLNGVSTGEVTNHPFTGESVGDYNVTVELAGYDSLSKNVTLADGETKTVGFIFSKYSGGDGTSVNPYQIHNSSDIRYLSTHSGDWDKHFIVMNDIDLALGGSPTATIGNVDSYPNNVFSGTFDGQGYTIHNFNLSIAGNYVGLFGIVGSGGNIRNLNVETDANGVHGDTRVGVIVGSNGGLITDCYATGNVTATGYNAGGLVGSNGGLITDCYATGNVTATGYNAGGLVGENYGSLENCYATGNVTVTGSTAGGLVGDNWGSLENCYATGNVTVTNSGAGGLAGVNWGSLENCYATGDASAEGDNAGGLVGDNYASLTNCYATGTANATSGSFAGGLVGLNNGDSPTNCYRYTNGTGSDPGTQITDITKFKDYAFLTGTTTDYGLNWSTGIISTNDDSSKIWFVSSLKNAYPTFQWDIEFGTLQVNSNPVDAIIWLDGIATGEVTNTALTDIPTGTHAITVVKSGYYPATRSITVAKDEVTDVSFTLTYPSDGSDGDDSTPFVKSTPAPTPEATVTTTPTPAVANPSEFTETARLPVGPDGTVERTVTILADDMSGYLTIDAGVVAQDASGMLQENISIAAVPATAIPSSGTIGLFANSQAVYAYTCTPEGMTFTPPITLTFTLSEEEWELYGNQAEVAWYNSISGEWEVIEGVADADARTITIQISHFSTYALFAEVVPEVALPDMTGIPAGSSGGTSLWLWGGLIVALVAVGGILISRRQDK